MVHDLFEETKAKAQSGEMNRKVFEEKITWLVYLIGALVGSNWTGRLPDVHVEGMAEAWSRYVESKEDPALSVNLLLFAGSICSFFAV